MTPPRSRSPRPKALWRQAADAAAQQGGSVATKLAAYLRPKRKATWKQAQDARSAASGGGSSGSSGGGVQTVSLRQRTSLPQRSRTRLRPLSLSRTRLLAFYEKLKRRWLKGMRCEICGDPNPKLHHWAKRAGTLLIDDRFFRAICNWDHIAGPNAIHRDEAAARRNGLLAPVGWQPPKDAETARLKAIIMELTA
jgi:hypothetical protein